MVTQGTSRTEAIEWLAGRAGLSQDRPLPALARAKPPASPTLVSLDPSVVSYVSTCEKILWDPDGRPVLAWLANRGLGEDVIRANRVGADPGRGMLRRGRGLPYGESMAATFPVLDQARNVRYVQTRYLVPRQRDKYDNPAAALGTNPRLSWTIPVGPARPGILLVCEGIPDALTAAQAGFSSAAVLGSHAPDESVASRIATRAERTNAGVVIVVDNDDAGRRWGQRLGDLLSEHGHHPHLIEPPVAGQDLNDWALGEPAWSDQIVTLTGPASETPADPVPGLGRTSELAVDIPITHDDGI